MIEKLSRTLLLHRRLSFGTLYPREWCEAECGDDHSLQTEVLVTTRDVDSVAISVRFLRLLHDGSYGVLEARDHAVELLATAPPTMSRFEELAVAIEVTNTPDDHDTTRIRVVVSNETALTADDLKSQRRDVHRLCLASTHVIYRRTGGGFVSLFEPPRMLAAAAARCENFGAWPVLVGDTGATDAMLGSPLILYDYPATDIEIEQVRGRAREGFAVGDHVIVRSLAGKHAEIVAIEESIDGGGALFAVVFAGGPGHRFFFRAAELAALS